LGRLKKPQQRGGYYHRQETLEYSEQNHPKRASESSSIPHADAQRPLNFISRGEVEDEYGAPPRYQSPSVQNYELDNNGEKTAGILTSPPSAVGCILLRPNRLGPNGDVESGNIQELPTTRGWVSNWTSQFKSPLGEFLTSLHLLVVSTDVPQMLCNHAVTDLIISMSSFFASSQKLS